MWKQTVSFNIWTKLSRLSSLSWLSTSVKWSPSLSVIFLQTWNIFGKWREEKKGVPFFSSDCQRLLVVMSFILYLSVLFLNTSDQFYLFWIWLLATVPKFNLELVCWDNSCFSVYWEISYPVHIFKNIREWSMAKEYHPNCLLFVLIKKSLKIMWTDVDYLKSFFWFPV